MESVICIRLSFSRDAGKYLIQMTKTLLSFGNSVRRDEVMLLDERDAKWLIFQIKLTGLQERQCMTVLRSVFFC